MSPAMAVVASRVQLLYAGDVNVQADDRARVGQHAAVEEEFAVRDDLEVDVAGAAADFFVVDADVGQEVAVGAVQVVDDLGGGVGADAGGVGLAAEGEGVSDDARVELHSAPPCGGADPGERAEIGGDGGGGERRGAGGIRGR